MHITYSVLHGRVEFLKGPAKNTNKLESKLDQLYWKFELYMYVEIIKEDNGHRLRY